MIQPLNGHVILSPIETEEQTIGNIIIPDLGKEKPEIGEVIATSDTFNWNTGEFKKSQLSVGEKVLIPKLGTMRVSVEGVDYYIVKETDILGIIK
jgi:chaperonin GroES